MIIGLILIGDEILSGKRTDLHLPKVIDILKARGLQLSWAHYLSDDPRKITKTLRETIASGDIVFSCGGIGATPDDHTRQCAAEALGVSLELHPEAYKAIKLRIEKRAEEDDQLVDMHSPTNLNRLKMGEFPVGAAIVPNAYNGIPGFSMGTHYFLPGFPEMAWPMIEWALDTYHAHLFHDEQHAEKAIRVFEMMEAFVTPLLEEIERSYPNVKTYSLPSVANIPQRRHIELGVKGSPFELNLAFEQILAWLKKHDAEFEYVDG